MSDRPKISLITITRDEEALIAQCLKSASFCDQKIIIDSFSTDKTVEIARGLGDGTIEMPADGFSVGFAGRAFGGGDFGEVEPGVMREKFYKALADETCRA